MRIKRMNRVRGYLLILIEGGSPERFLNICNVHQIEIWNLNHTPEGYECNISIADFRRLKPIVRKTRTRLMIRKRYGVPFFLHKYRHRKAFFIGIMAAFLMIYVLSLFVWDIHLVGNYSHTEQTLLDFLSEEQITHGMKISEVDCDRIEKLIRNEYDDIVWVSASVSGTRLIIEIQENFSNFVEADTEEYGDIVADRDCRITSIITRSGTPLVKKGDIVTKGDILVSGVVEICDEYGEVLKTEYTCADADIYGESVYFYEDSVNLNYEEKVYTGEEKEALALTAFGNRLFLKAGRTGFEHYDIYTEKYQLSLGTNFYLPFSLEKWYYKEYTLGEQCLTKEGAEALLKKNINDFFENLIQKGVQIVEERVKIDVDDKMGSASGEILLLCPQGKWEPFAERNEIIYEYNGNDD